MFIALLFITLNLFSSQDVFKYMSSCVFPIFYNSPSGPRGATSFVYDKDRGLLITNYHVTHRGYEFFIEAKTGEKYPARVVLADHKMDVAIIATDPAALKNAQNVKFSTKKPYNGQKVFILGNQGLNGFVLREGHFVDVNYRVTRQHRLGTVTNCTGGMSGSPWVSEDLLLVGMASEGVPQDHCTVPLYGIQDTIRRAEALLAGDLNARKGRTLNRYGLRFLTKGELEDYFDVPKGVFLRKAYLIVQEIFPRVDQTEEKYPLELNDIVLAGNGKIISSQEDLCRLILESDHLTLTVYRPSLGRELIIEVPLDYYTDDDEEMIITDDFMVGKISSSVTNSEKVDGVFINNQKQYWHMLEYINGQKIQNIHTLLEEVKERHVFSVGIRRETNTLDLRMTLEDFVLKNQENILYGSYNSKKGCLVMEPVRRCS